MYFSKFLVVVCLLVWICTVSWCSSTDTDKLDNIYLWHMLEKGYLEHDFSRLYWWANSVSVNFYDSSATSTNLEIKNFFNETIHYTGINIDHDNNKLILQNTTNVWWKIYVLSGFIDNNNHLLIETYWTGINKDTSGLDTFILSGSILNKSLQNILQKNFFCEYTLKNIETDEILNTYTWSMYLGIENWFITLTENYRMTFEWELIKSNDIKKRMVVEKYEDSKIILHQLWISWTWDKEFNIVFYDENLQTITMESTIIREFKTYSKCTLLD